MSKIRVAVRTRPLLPSDGTDKQLQINVDKDLSKIVLEKRYPFKFSHVFGHDATQAGLFDECVSPIIESVFKGENATVIAYGQTGAGKTFTLGSCASMMNTKDTDRGIIPRLVESLFEYAEPGSMSVDVSAVEIYNEELVDLLVPTPFQRAGGAASSPRGSASPRASSPRRPALSIQDHADGTNVAGLLVAEGLTTKDAILDTLHKALSQRAEAKMNAKMSSRSHAVCSLSIHKKGDATEISRVTVVDLAGSERLRKGSHDEARIRESIFINAGLLALGNVIAAITNKAKGAYIPYRDSKLTRLLQSALGGNSNTLFIGCVSPVAGTKEKEEALCTLRYATRASKVQQRIKPNVQSRYLGSQIARPDPRPFAAPAEAHSDARSTRTTEDELIDQMAAESDNLDSNAFNESKKADEDRNPEDAVTRSSSSLSHNRARVSIVRLHAISTDDADDEEDAAVLSVVPDVDPSAKFMPAPPAATAPAKPSTEDEQQGDDDDDDDILAKAEAAVATVVVDPPPLTIATDSSSASSSIPSSTESSPTVTPLPPPKARGQGNASPRRRFKGAATGSSSSSSSSPSVAAAPPATATGAGAAEPTPTVTPSPPTAAPPAASSPPTPTTLRPPTLAVPARFKNSFSGSAAAGGGFMSPVVVPRALDDSKTLSETISLCKEQIVRAQATWNQVLDTSSHQECGSEAFKETQAKLTAASVKIAEAQEAVSSQSMGASTPSASARTAARGQLAVNDAKQAVEIAVARVNTTAQAQRDRQSSIGTATLSAGQAEIADAKRVYGAVLQRISGTDCSVIPPPEAATLEAAIHHAMQAIQEAEQAAASGDAHLCASKTALSSRAVTELSAAWDNALRQCPATPQPLVPGSPRRRSRQASVGSMGGGGGGSGSGAAAPTHSMGRRASSSFEDLPPPRPPSAEDLAPSPPLSSGDGASTATGPSAPSSDASTRSRRSSWDGLPKPRAPTPDDLAPSPPLMEGKSDSVTDDMRTMAHASTPGVPPPKHTVAATTPSASVGPPPTLYGDSSVGSGSMISYQMAAPPVALNAEGVPVLLSAEGKVVMGRDGRPVPVLIGPDGVPIPMAYAPDGSMLPIMLNSEGLAVIGPDGYPMMIGLEGTPVLSDGSAVTAVGPDGEPLSDMEMMMLLGMGGVGVSEVGGGRRGGGRGGKGPKGLSVRLNGLLPPKTPDSNTKKVRMPRKKKSVQLDQLPPNERKKHIMLKQAKSLAKLWGKKK